MIPTAPTAVAPAATPAAAPATTSTDTYGDKVVAISKLPVAGYQKGNRFTPATADNTPTEASADPAAPVVEAAPEVVDGKPAETPAAQPASVTLKAKNGREFKDHTELLNTYDASSTEAMRLATEAKTQKMAVEDMSGKLTEANATILAMQEYIGNGAYTPNVPEKYKGMTEPEMMDAMTEDEKLDYRLDRREWTKKVENFKTQMATAKQESEALAARTKAEIDRVETVMSQDNDSYPDFTELAPLRNEIFKQSPHLANRPDSHYVAYYMAQGIVAAKEKAEAVRLETESRNKAAGHASAAAANGGGGAPQQPGKSPAPKDDGLRGLVNAAKGLKSSF